MPLKPICNIAVSTTHPELETQARSLATQLGLPFTTSDIQSYPFLLVLTPTQLELKDLTQPKLKPISVNFTSGKLAYRRYHGGGSGQLIARAVGIKPKIKLKILDVTAGLGEDAFVLATLGCSVTMLERSPIIAALLQDGLNRAKQNAEFQTLSLTLIEASAHSYLTTLNAEQYPDVIYLDPMFPESNKSALVKKEMRLLRQVVGDDPDSHELLTLALARTKKRVVVKRARLAPPLSNIPIDIVFSGKSSRFDVYFKK